MNTKTLQGISAAVSLLVGIGAASPALATFTGAQALGAAAYAIDVWTFPCPAAFPRAIARVYDIAPGNNPALMQVALGKDSVTDDEVTDLNPGAAFGEGGGPSGFADVPDGAGLYAMAFKKTAGGVEGYNGEAYCVNAGGGLLNPPLTLRISQ